jgi:hypothetical protein
MRRTTALAGIGAMAVTGMVALAPVASADRFGFGKKDQKDKASTASGSGCDCPTDLYQGGIVGRVLNNTPIGNVIEYGPKSILAGNGGPSADGTSLPGTPIWNTIKGPLTEPQAPFSWLNGVKMGQSQTQTSNPGS